MLILASPAMWWEWHYLRELVVVVYFITTSAAPNSLKAGKSRVNPPWNSGNWWQIHRIVTCPSKGSHPQLQQPCPQSVCFPSLQNLGIFCLQVQDWSHTAIVEPSLWCMMVWGASLDLFWTWQGGTSIWNRGTWKSFLEGLRCANVFIMPHPTVGNCGLEIWGRRIAQLELLHTPIIK